MKQKTRFSALVAGAVAMSLLLGASAAQAEVAIDWVTVGDPGNADDTAGWGGVDYAYQISRFEVTNTEYAEFLNAVAATDTHELYHTGMGFDPGGITQAGSPGSYTYSVIAGREEMPVTNASFWDATRFANWLHNGQPTGAQDSTTTEDGAYTLTQEGITNNTVTRNDDAEVFVPSEDEWYKAAYYAGSDSYYDYPAGSDTQTTCDLPVPDETANTANCDYQAEADLTDVGSYQDAASPSGTFDQGGNAFEWTEAISNVRSRVLRGGSFMSAPQILEATWWTIGGPDRVWVDVGFRVARPSADIGSVTLTGDVQDEVGTPLCSLALASGQFMFTCNPNGPYELLDLPTESDGTVKRQVYVDGFFPNVETLTGSADETVVMTRASNCPDYNSFPEPSVVPGSADKQINVSGTILLQNTQTPVCAMALANGQFGFTCDDTGTYSATIPLDANGQYKLQVYADGFAPMVQRFDEFTPDVEVRLARADECQ